MGSHDGALRGPVVVEVYDPRMNTHTMAALALGIAVAALILILVLVA